MVHLARALGLGGVVVAAGLAFAIHAQAQAVGSGLPSTMGTSIRTVALVPCTTPTLIGSPASQAPTGATVTFTATTSGCVTPNYRFWISPPAGGWTIVQDYSATNTFAWSGTGLSGIYGVEVDVRDSGSSVGYDAVRNITYLLTGCTSVTLSAPTGHFGTMGVTATATCGGIPTYRFWMRPPGGAWAIVQDYGLSSSFSWSLPYTQPPGTYGIEVDVRNQNATAAYEAVANISWVWAGVPCTSVSLQVSQPLPAPTGSTVVLTGAFTSGCPNPQFRFWIRPPNGAWSMVQDYSSLNTYNWHASGAPGVYFLEVDVRQMGETVAYDVVGGGSISLVGCTAAGLTASPVSPGKTGTTVQLTASATCPGTPEYRFWVRKPGDSWRINQDYGVYVVGFPNRFSWDTTGLPYGTYGLEVDVRDQGATSPYEVVFNTTYVLVPITCSDAGYGTGGIPVVTSVTPNWGSIDPTHVTISGCGFTGATAVTLANQSATSVVVVSDTTITAVTPAYPIAPGDPRIPGEEFPVDIQITTPLGTSPLQQSDRFFYFYPGAACSTASLTASPASPGATGSTIVLTASTFTCTSPQYRFWISAPGGSWRIVQDYSATNTYTWTAPNTGVAGTYRLEVDVRNAGEAVAYDRVANITYSLTGCSAAHLATDKASPQVRGTTIVLTGSATCAGTPEYRFWVRDATGHWTIVQDYSTSNTFSWNTTGLPAGTYGLEVDVRNQGSTAVYETVANLTFGVT